MECKNLICERKGEKLCSLHLYDICVRIALDFDVVCMLMFVFLMFLLQCAAYFIKFMSEFTENS